MKKQTSWPDDPVVNEVRKVRQEIWREAGGTIEGLLAWLDREVQPKPAGKRRTRRPRRK